MKKLLLFIASMLMTVSLMAADLKTSEPMKLAETTIKGVALSAPVEEAPSLSQFEVPVVETIKLSEKNIPDGIENAQRTGIRKAPAATVKISGLVDASTIADNAVIELVGNANLFMDVSKTFKCISGDYALTLSGGNTLTLSNAEGYAINVSSVTISCHLVVQASYVAIAATSDITINNSVNAKSTNTCIGTLHGTISINADVIATTSSSAAILNRGGHIIINGGTVNATGGTSGDWAFGIAAIGRITSAEGTTINATGGTAIYSEQNYINFAGSVTATAKGAKGYGIYAKNANVTVAEANIPQSYVAIGAEHDININGTTVANSTNTCIGTIDGTIIVNADLTATTTSSAALLSRQGRIAIQSGTTTVTGGISGDWHYGIAAGARVSSKAGTTVNAIGGTAIYVESGDISLLGTTTATAKHSEGYGIYAKAGTATLSQITIPQSYIAIGAHSGLTLNGIVDAKSTNTCIGTYEGTLIINTDVTASTTYSAAILNRSGNIIINSGTINVSGGVKGDWHYGIAATGNITAAASATINATAGTAIYSETENINLSGSVTATAKHSEGYGIYAKAGTATLSQITIPQSYIAIGAHSGLTLNGIVDAKSTNTCIGTYEGTISISTDVTASTNKSAAILNRKGDITINGGTINVTGGISGDWHYGIAATGNITAAASATINATAGTAIYSETENINLSGSVTATAKHSEGYGIYAKAGTATLSQITIPQSYIAIGAHSGLTLNGIVDAKSTNTCIGTYEGTLTINNDVTATTDHSAAIFNRGGDIIINSGEVNATGGMTGKWAYGIAALENIQVKAGKVIAKGGKGMYAENGSISITSPLVVITAAGGGISADGHTVVYDSGNVASRVVIMDPPVKGAVALSTAPSPGNELGFTLSGDIASAQTENIWQISDDDATWQDIEENAPAGAPAQDGVSRARKVASELVYVPTEDQVGKYIRVKVAADQHSGYIYSPSRQIAKKLCTDVPVIPTLTNINDQVYVSNAKTTQEYLIFTTSKDISSLTESDWADAVTPESEVGFFELNSATNTNNIVFTRIKETVSTLASEAVAESRLYIGTSVYLTDIELSVSKTVGYFQNINNELNCKVGDVIRCDAVPVPSNATNWYGISGSNWTVDNRNTGSPYGTFYEDADCTVPINTSTNYKTVYLKTLTEKNYLEVRILYYNSGIGYKSRAKEFNVTPDGYFPLLDYINGCSRTIAAGEKITGIEVSRRPFSGSVYGLTTEVSGEGIAPVVSFSLYETMTINAINATPGVYVYTPLQNGHPLNNNTTFTITVTDGKYAVDSLILRENAITADPNEELELVAQLMPSNSEAAITWTSSNTSVATVTNGIVTIAANAPIGAKATITATANGKSDECQITVSGEEYDLYVASTRVTSRNQDDILGDGTFSFDGMSTLTIKGDYTINNSANLVRNTGIDGLYINIAQACTISQGEESYSTLFDLRKSTAIHGEQMTVNGNGIAFSTQGGMTLTLDSANLVVSAIMPFKGSGIDEDNMNIMNSHIEVNASGSAAIFSFAGGISLTDCHIQIPTNAVVTNGTIEDGNGSQVRNLLIVPNPVKTEPALAFASSEATAIVGETFTAPILSNPNNLTITYYSEDPMIAKVDAETGEVTPISAGTTTIIAYTDGNLYHMAGQVSYTLIVLKGSVSLSFTQNSVNVRIDDEEFVLPTLNNPQDVSVTYSSSNPAVATVLALTGDVTLVAAGTTTITATFLGDKSYNEASASYDLIVTESTATDLNYISTQPNASSVQKILLSGQLLILRDGKTYNVMGQKL